jgi:hypothetical protein
MGRLAPSNRATGWRRGDERGGREARSLVFPPRLGVGTRSSVEKGVKSWFGLRIAMGPRIELRLVQRVERVYNTFLVRRGLGLV